MTQPGLGQTITTTGRNRSKVLKDAMGDSHPVFKAMEEVGGIREEDGGRTVVEEAKTAQNSTVKWVGESGGVALQDTKVLDALEYDWKYLLGAVTISHAERYQNMGGSDKKIINLVGGKFEVLEETMMNYLHAGMLSNGTGEGGLQLTGLAALVSTTPTTGTIGTVDRSNANAAWARNQAFDTSADWSLGAVDAGNVKRFYDKGINSTMKNSSLQVQLGLAGDTHFEHLTAALQAHQIIQNESKVGRVGFDKLVYRGVPIYLSGGINYSGLTAQTDTQSYLLNVKPGGVNLVFHEKARFEMLEPVNASDQAGYSRLMFTMVCMLIGGVAKTSWVGFD